MKTYVYYLYIPISYEPDIALGTFSTPEKAREARDARRAGHASRNPEILCDRVTVDGDGDEREIFSLD